MYWSPVYVVVYFWASLFALISAPTVLINVALMLLKLRNILYLCPASSGTLLLYIGPLLFYMN